MHWMVEIDYWTTTNKHIVLNRVCATWHDVEDLIERARATARPDLERVVITREDALTRRAQSIQQSPESRELDQNEEER